MMLRAFPLTAVAAPGPMKRLAFLVAVACLWGAALPGTGRAGFVGQSVDVSYRFPDVSTVYSDVGTQTIAAGTQLTDILGDRITFSDTTIDISLSGGRTPSADYGRQPHLRYRHLADHVRFDRRVHQPPIHPGKRPHSGRGLCSDRRP
jgi:hypothetical protein